MTKTRHDKQMFREACCPSCGQWVRVTSLQDDTRWRYGKHLIQRDIEICDMSMELVPKEAP